MDSASLVTVTLLAALNICWGFVSSIQVLDQEKIVFGESQSIWCQAPFLPLEARRKGATAAEFGPIFGIIHLALALTSPLVPWLVSKCDT